MSTKSLLKKVKKLRRAIDDLELGLTQDTHQLIVEAEQRGQQKAYQEALSIADRACREGWEPARIEQHLRHASVGLKIFKGIDDRINTDFGKDTP